MKDQITEEELKRQTYYLTEDLIKAISLKSAFEDIEKSVIVREALEEYIDKEYMEKAKKLVNSKDKKIKLKELDGLSKINNNKETKLKGVKSNER